MKRVRKTDREEYELNLRGYFLDEDEIWHTPDGDVVLLPKRPALPPPLDSKALYTSKDLPPDVGRDRFHRLVKDCPGAYKTGRLWQVPARAWRDWRAGTAQEAAPIVDDARALAYAALLK